MRPSPNKRLQLTSVRLGCFAGSHGRRPLVWWLTRSGHRFDTRRYTGRPQLNRDPLGGARVVIRKHLLLIAMLVSVSGATEEGPVYVPPPRPQCEKSAPPNGPAFERLDPYFNSDYAKFLIAFGEEPLRPTGSESLETYRFLYLPSFQNPRLVRIERSGKRYKVVSKRLSGQGGYSPEKLEAESSAELDRKTWDRVRRLLTEADFWNLTSHQAIVEYEAAVARANCDFRTGGSTDGVILVVEGATASLRHAVDRMNLESR